MELIQPYGMGLIALLVFVLITLLQTAIVGYQKAAASLTSGSTPEANYDSALYRFNRSHQNATENMAAISIAFVACVLTGVSPWWVNLLMGLYLLLRLIYIFIYAQKIGAEAQGPRTFSYVASWAVNVVLAIMAIVAVL